MGADLYIKSVTDKAHEENQKAFDHAVQNRDNVQTEAEKGQLQKEVDKCWDAMYPEGYYFRDSYNESNLLWQMGLSWWSNTFIKHHYMSAANAKKFKQIILNKPITEVKFGHPEWVKDPDDPEWLTSFQTRREELIKFLDNAINLKERIYCSV